MLGEALKKIRLYSQLSQIELAKKLGVRNSQISDIEKNRRAPSQRMLNLYSEKLNIPLSNIHYLSEKLENESSNSFLTNKILSIINWLAMDSSCIECGTNEEKEGENIKLEVQ